MDVPTHIGFIMDGNRRWAESRGLPKVEGHVVGQDALREVSREAFERGVKYVSAYVFSTENWHRAPKEVSFLMDLVVQAAKKYLNEFHEAGIKLVILGERSGLSKKVLQTIQAAEDKTKDNTNGTLALCFNYGGQEEIASATRKIIESGMPAEEVTIDTISQNIYGPEIPLVDVIVRTSGEQRISNFMLWRAAYSELIFLDKYWPDMTKEDVSVILNEYSQRQRRFGK